jgi:hypothetical protein
LINLERFLSYTSCRSSSSSSSSSSIKNQQAPSNGICMRVVRKEGGVRASSGKPAHVQYQQRNIAIRQDTRRQKIVCKIRLYAVATAAHP